MANVIVRSAPVCALLLSAAVIVAASSPGETYASPASRPTCGAPKFEVSPFKTSADDRDRGYISGISLVDTDDDGDLDLYFTGGYDVSAKSLKELKIDRARFYLNDGKGHFTRDDDNALSNTLRVGSGSTWADVLHSPPIV